MSERRRNGFSASRGLDTRTAGPVRPTSSCAAAETKVSVHPSEAPSPARMSFMVRLERCKEVNPPGWGHVGTWRGTLE